MDQYIFELSVPSVPSSPSFWVPVEDGTYSSPSTEGSSDSNSMFPLHEDGDFEIHPQSMVIMEGYVPSSIQNSYSPPQSLATDAKRKSASAQRRRVQNRKSQQAFRERQAQRVQSLEQSVEELLKRRDDYEQASKRAEILEGTVKELLKQKGESEKTYSELKAKYDQLKEDVKRLAA